MPIFEIKTISTIENIYWVEADSEGQAVMFTLDSNLDEGPEFVQKHIGEKVVSNKIINGSYKHWLREKHEDNYY